MKKQRNFIIGIVIALILVVFALFNNDPAKINFVFTTISLPLVLILFICILLGALVTYLFATASNYTAKKTLKSLQGQVDSLQHQQDQAIAKAVAAEKEKIVQTYTKQLKDKDDQIDKLKSENQTLDADHSSENDV